MSINKFVSMALLLALAGGVTSSCSKSDDEKTPEIVDDPMKDIVEYYINGKVTDKNGAAIEGVSVKIGSETVASDAKGEFKATVTEKGEYAVSASKDGYLNAQGLKAVIADNASNRESVGVSFVMTKKSADVTVNVEGGSTSVVLTPESQKNDESEVVSGTALNVPAANMEDGTTYSMTEYQAENDDEFEGAESGDASVMNVYVSTGDKSVSANGVAISIKNPVSGKGSFSSMSVYKSSNSRAGSSYQKIGDAHYDAATNSYRMVMADGEMAGDYSFRIPFTTSKSAVKSEVIKEDKVDNSGNMSAVNDVKISYTAKLGSEYSGFSGMDSSLAALMDNAVYSQIGAAGVYTADYENTANVSGNNIMYYKVENTYVNTTYTFQLADGPVSTTVKTYTGSKVTYTQESANKHNGGSTGGGNN